MKTKFKAVFMLLLVISAFTSCGKNSQLRFGTGNKGGNYYAYGKAIAEASENTVTVKETAGSHANMRLLSEGYIDMAIVQSDVLAEAVDGTEDFSGNPVSSVRAVAGLYNEAFQIVINPDSGISSIADLKGKRISFGEEGSGVLENAQQLLLSAGIKYNDVEPVYMTYSESADALKNNEIDAFFVVLGTPSEVISDIVENSEAEILSLDDRTIYYMLNLYSGYSEMTIPAGTHKNQDKDIKTIGVKAVLVADEKADSKKINDITKSLFDGKSVVENISPPDVDFAVSDIPCDFHKGAVNYYNSIGTDVSGHQNK